MFQEHIDTYRGSEIRVGGERAREREREMIESEKERAGDTFCNAIFKAVKTFSLGNL